jgi:polar amino acid transport system substrate-binding protein
MKKRVVVLATLISVVVFLGLALTACSAPAPSSGTGASVVQEDSLQRILKAGKLVVATDLNSVPIQFKDAQGKPVGFLVELMDLAAQELGVTLEWQDMPWESLIPSLTSGKVDMIAANMSMTLARFKTIRFSHPYMFTGVAIMVRKDGGITNWKDLLAPGRKLGTTMGSSHAAYLRDNFNYDPMQFESALDGTNVVKNRGVDGIMDDELLLLEFAKQDPNLLVLPDVVRPDAYGLTFRQGTQEDTLVRWFDWFMTWQKLTGSYGEIYQKYIGKPWTPNPIIQ